MAGPCCQQSRELCVPYQGTAQLSSTQKSPPPASLHLLNSSHCPIVLNLCWASTFHPSGLSSPSPCCQTTI